MVEEECGCFPALIHKFCLHVHMVSGFGSDSTVEPLNEQPPFFLKHFVATVVAGDAVVVRLFFLVPNT